MKETEKEKYIDPNKINLGIFQVGDPGIFAVLELLRLNRREQTELDQKNTLIQKLKLWMREHTAFLTAALLNQTGTIPPESVIEKMNEE